MRLNDKLIDPTEMRQSNHSGRVFKGLTAKKGRSSQLNRTAELGPGAYDPNSYDHHRNSPKFSIPSQGTTKNSTSIKKQMETYLHKVLHLEGSEHAETEFHTIGQA